MAQSILGRIGQLVRANVSALIDQAEDPEKMLDQLLRDFTENISEAEQAVAQTVGNLRLLEEDLREAQQAVDEWNRKALAASRKADELSGPDGQKFNDLAKIALRRQVSYEEQARTMSGQVAQQTELVAKLKDGLGKLRLRREELARKRDELVSRSKMADAQVQVQEAVRNVSVMDPSSELSRFEERIRQQEALAHGMEEVSSDSVEEQFAVLEQSEAELEVEARLAALKGGEPLEIEASPPKALETPEQ